MGGCGRWPEHLRLVSEHGELVRGRCGGTNVCAYCARLAAVENAELLALDALAGNAPEVWAVLTTRTAALDNRRFYRSRERVMVALKRRWPDVQYAAMLEFTTGYSKRSRGRRFPHWNLMLKGIPASDVDAAREVIVRVWCAREDAKPDAQFVETIADAGGVLCYIALHFQKESQAPPAGWRGHRFLKSHGYLATTTPVAREAARSSLRFKRELWRAIRAGAEGLEADAIATAAHELAQQTSWMLVQVNPAPTDERPVLGSTERVRAHFKRATVTARPAPRVTSDAEDAPTGDVGEVIEGGPPASWAPDADAPVTTAGRRPLDSESAIDPNPVWAWEGVCGPGMPPPSPGHARPDPMAARTAAPPPAGAEREAAAPPGRRALPA